jgi:hypothetical protein
MNRHLKTTALAAFAGAILIGLVPARAATIDFDFCGTGANCVVPNAKENTSLGATASFTASGYTITAAGFKNATFGNTENIFAKNGGSNENGLGLTNDPSGDNEISGSSLIEISLPSKETDFSFQMGSTTNGEGWLVYGSNSPTSGFVLVASGKDENNHTLTGTTPGLNDGDYQYYYFAFDGSTYNWWEGNTNVLLADVDFNVAATPIPGTLPLLATGLVGLFALRRKRKVDVISA